MYSFMYLYVAHDSLVCLYTSCIYCADRTAWTANALWSIDVSIYINLHIYINILIHISVYITWFIYLYTPIIRSTVGTAWTAGALWRIDISIHILSYIYILMHISIHTIRLPCRSYCVDYRSSCRSPTPSLQPLVAHSSNSCKHREWNKGGGGLGGRVDQGRSVHGSRGICPSSTRGICASSTRMVYMHERMHTHMHTCGQHILITPHRWETCATCDRMHFATICSTANLKLPRIRVQ